MFCSSSSSFRFVVLIQGKGKLLNWCLCFNWSPHVSQRAMLFPCRWGNTSGVVLVRSIPQGHSSKGKNLLLSRKRWSGGSYNLRHRVDGSVAHTGHHYTDVVAETS